MHKTIIKASNSALPTITITMYLYPTIYDDLEEVIANVKYDPRQDKYITDINPARTINGPLSDYKQELENPIKDEYESFIRDCKWVVQDAGFTIITTERSIDSKKSEYLLVYGVGKTPCGRLIYDLRLSDHPFDAKFPEHLKDTALEYLKINSIIDGTAEKAGIDFAIEKVTVGTVRDDTWQRAINRLYRKLKQMRDAIQHRLHREENSQ